MPIRCLKQLCSPWGLQGTVPMQFSKRNFWGIYILYSSYPFESFQRPREWGRLPSCPRLYKILVTALITRADWLCDTKRRVVVITGSWRGPDIVMIGAGAAALGTNTQNEESKYHIKTITYINLNGNPTLLLSTLFWLPALIPALLCWTCARNNLNHLMDFFFIF